MTTIVKVSAYCLREHCGGLMAWFPDPFMPEHGEWRCLSCAR